MFKRVIGAALIFGAAALAPPATAQNARTYCAPRDTIVQTLMGRYAETLYAGGLQSQSNLLEVWSSPESGSFTILMTRPNGISCVMASGEHWHFETQRPAGEVSG
ncbi:hypothetical protein [Cochlodiniinecator piscidefendens]|uniref:hypothetical protein n=1 Tax=Cochlodiniinecator piscidefendens TaxID=2715756 RepID=UPI0014072FF0|nr:hypothetical protein [Cochlodiniinecator piscidefendens]